jgi:hypothetical protein
VKKFTEEIKMFHDHGIMVNPGIVFGFDHDDESVFERAVEFLTKNRVELAYFNVLTPLPGTTLFERYDSAGRIFDRDWAKYDGKHVVFQPSRMTPEQLREGFHWANHQFYSLPSIWKRLSGTSQRFIPRWEMNREFRKLVKRSCPRGTLSPVAMALKTLEARLPSLETDHVIPNALHVIRGMDGEQAGSSPASWLGIKAKRHDQCAALMVDLDGTLDRVNAVELLKRLGVAAEKAGLDIIVNFEYLKHATPDALKALVDGAMLKGFMPHARLQYRKFKDAFAHAVHDLAISPTSMPTEV